MQREHVEGLQKLHAVMSKHDPHSEEEFHSMTTALHEVLDPLLQRGVLGEKEALVKEAKAQDAKWMQGLKKSFAEATKEGKAQTKREEEEKRRLEKEERAEQRKREAAERKNKQMELKLELEREKSKSKRSSALFGAARLAAPRVTEDLRGTSTQDLADGLVTTEPTGGRHESDVVGVS